MITESVDRIEGDWIVLVPESVPAFQIPVSLFPGLITGDVIRVFVEKDESGEKDAEERIGETRKGLN